jgi:hypothetical protein
MRSEIEILIRELLGPPMRGHRERATPEQIEQNRREIAIQNEINERAWRKAYPDSLATDSTNNTDQAEEP